MKTLLYISNNALLKNKKWNPFFDQEYDLCMKHFDDSYLICPSGVYIMNEKRELQLLYGKSVFIQIISIVKGIISIELIKNIFKYIKQLGLNIKDLARIALFSIHGITIYQYIHKLSKKVDINETTMYSYWLSYDSYGVALAKKKWSKAWAVSRGHAYDIQIDRSMCNPFMMKEFTLNKLDAVYCISECAKKELFTYIEKPVLRKKVFVSYLGSPCHDTGYNENRAINDTIFLISCSSLIELKQINLIIDTLSLWDGKNITWYHIGDGVLANELKEYAHKKLEPKNNICYDFIGAIKNEEVRVMLQQDKINFFVNVSRTEGVPVSIMEAMSFGIPVIAPNINGIPELVNEKAGFLLDGKNIKDELFETLTKIVNMNHLEYTSMCKEAYDVWNDKFVLDRNFLKVVKPHE